MKKCMVTFLSGIISMQISLVSFAENLNTQVTAIPNRSQSESIRLQIHGEEVKNSLMPVIENNRTLVPARLVFEKLGAVVSWDANSKKVSIQMQDKTITLKINRKVATVNESMMILDVPAKIIQDATYVPLRFVGEQLGMQVAWNSEKKLISIGDEKNQTLANLKNVAYQISQQQLDVLIQLDKLPSYQTLFLSNPDRIVIDLPKTVTSQTNPSKMQINHQVVKAIRYAQLDTDTAKRANLDGETVRVVLDLNKNVNFDIQKDENQLRVRISGEEEQAQPEHLQSEQVQPATDRVSRGNVVREKSLKNLHYINHGDRVVLLLDKLILTEGGSPLTQHYSAGYDESKKKFTVRFLNERANLEEGTLPVDDAWLEKIVVEKGEALTKIHFYAKEVLEYNIFTRENLQNTAITLLKPATAKEQLVVIDPGHGGVEVGAVSQGILEKDLNLDIAARTNAILKAKGIKTYMIREEDAFVGLYERAYIANTLNAALFLSIHNNAAGENISGTETLYHSPDYLQNQFNGKKFAAIVQSKLIDALKTNDRKIVSRPNLVVLKATTMPSALAEIAFMSHGPDLEKLKDEAFRQKAAKALAEAILEALKEI